MFLALSHDSATHQQKGWATNTFPCLCGFSPIVTLVFSPALWFFSLVFNSCLGFLSFFMGMSFWCRKLILPQGTSSAHSPVLGSHTFFWTIIISSWNTSWTQVGAWVPRTRWSSLPPLLTCNIRSSQKVAGHGGWNYISTPVGLNGIGELLLYFF